MVGRLPPSPSAGFQARATLVRDGARMKGVPVVIWLAVGDAWVGSSAFIDCTSVAPWLPPLELARLLENSSADREYCPLLFDLFRGMSLPCELLLSLGALPALLRFRRATAGFVGVPASNPSFFSPSSSLCSSIFFLRPSHALLTALLSYTEKGRG
jgi:hypothetical protein